MTLSPQNPNRRSQNGARGSASSSNLSAESLTDAKLPQPGLTQAEADAFIESLPAIRREKELKEKLTLSVSQIGLSEKATHILLDRGIFTVEDLLKFREAELREIPRLGDTTVSDILSCVSRLGFQRRPH